MAVVFYEGDDCDHDECKRESKGEPLALDNSADRCQRLQDSKRDLGTSKIAAAAALVVTVVIIDTHNVVNLFIINEKDKKKVFFKSE